MTKPITDSASPAPIRSTIDLPSTLPYSLFKPVLDGPNPVFDYEFKRLHWPKTIRQLDQNDGQVTFVAFFAYVGLFAVMTASNSVLFRLNSGFVIMFALLPIVVSLILATAADLYYAMLTIRVFHNRLMSDQWDLMRLSNQCGDNIINAYFAILQIQAWRLLKVERAFRLVGLAIMLLALTLGGGFSVLLFLRVVPYIVLPALGLMAAMFWAYWREPVWRMPTIVAFGLAIGAQVRNPTYTTLGVVAGILGLRLVQSAAVVMFISALNSVAYDLASSLGILLLIAAAFNPIAHFTYNLLQRRFLKRAEHFAFLSE